MMHRGALPAMGTRFEIVVGGANPLLLRAAVEQAFEEISTCHRLWNVFSKDSILSQIHSESSGRPVAIDGLTLDLLRTCSRLHQQTGGSFDPVIGADLAAGDPRRDPILGAAPRDGFAGIELDVEARTVRRLDSRLRFDLGGIAKGYACDLAASILLEAAVDCALIHGGTSSVVALGAPPGRSDWSIEVKGYEGKQVGLVDGALAVTSAAGGGAGAHLIDPFSGDRLDRHRAGAMVVGHRATDCDAWATALTVDGFDGEVARQIPATLQGYRVNNGEPTHLKPDADASVEEERWKRTVEIS
ncbi:MAG: FAD:protein FMN transferase [Planctomycetota bacterium]|nr:FAD:protein FMN transferase [Planctomycetota bacterium]